MGVGLILRKAVTFDPWRCAVGEFQITILYRYVSKNYLDSQTPPKKMCQVEYETHGILILAHRSERCLETNFFLQLVFLEDGF